MADTQLRQRNLLQSRFPSQGHVEDFDRMYEIGQLIKDLEAENEALAYHAYECIETMGAGELVFSKVDPNRVYEVMKHNHMVSYTIKTVITDKPNQRTERAFGEST